MKIDPRYKKIFEESKKADISRALDLNMNLEVVINPNISVSDFLEEFFAREVINYGSKKGIKWYQKMANITVREMGLDKYANLSIMECCQKGEYKVL
nr:hypothetical protein [Candidatus Woesearchaeota archaeon]